MASIRDRLEIATYKARRRLFDNNVRLTGQEIRCIRLKIETNKYGDDNDFTVISRGDIIVRFVFPDEIPLNRFRADATKDNIDSETVFMWDLLPITCYAQFKDNLEKGDFLIFKIRDDQDKSVIIVLQVTENIGKFTKIMGWKKNYCAPFHGQFNDEMIALIEAYEKEPDFMEGGTL